MVEVARRPGHGHRDLRWPRRRDPPAVLGHRLRRSPIPTTSRRTAAARSDPGTTSRRCPTRLLRDLADYDTAFGVDLDARVEPMGRSPDATSRPDSTPTTAEETAKQIEYLARALKAPRIREAAARLADQARDAGWTHEEYLAAVLSGRSPPAKPPVPSSGSGPRGSRAASRSRTSTSTTSPASNATRSPTWPPATFLAKAARTWCCSARPGPARPTSRSGSGSRPPSRAPGPVRHRDRLGHPAPERPRQPAGSPHELARLRRYGLHHRRRGRLHPVRTRRREPVLPARLIPLRTRLADPDHQPALRPLGRRLRRPGRRRRDDRPHRPPRRSPHPQRQLLPAQGHRHRHPALRQSRKHGTMTNTEVAQLSKSRTGRTFDER